MQFYKFKLKAKESSGSVDLGDRETMMKYRRAFESKLKESSPPTLVFMSSITSASDSDEYIIEGAAVTADIVLVPWDIEEVVSDCGFSVDQESVDWTECTSHDFGKQMQYAEEQRFLPRTNDFLDEFDPLLDVYDVRNGGIWQRSDCYEEKISKCPEREVLEKKAESILWAPSLTDELHRIGASPTAYLPCGIPVQYILCGNNQTKRAEAVDILISALYQNSRISQRRYADISVSLMGIEEARELESLFELYKDGTIVFRFRRDARKESGRADVSYEVISRICDCIKDYRTEVQVILCFPLACEKEKEMFFERLNGVSFVTLEEGSADREDALRYLTEKAKAQKYESLDGLAELVSEDRSYRGVELDRMYHEWSANYLKNVVYPLYADVKSVDKQEVSASPKGNAYEKLQSMIGLESAKRVIDDAINYCKTQKLLAARHMKTAKTSMHMVFTGNPGTAKTTVARLFAEIMRDNKVLANGHMVEVGRGDLVGKFVGWTAQIVQKKFAEARGGVLFIDEAYSLVDDRDGSYGDEAINTIVQEMENNRNDVVVIFAGYPKEMEGFLLKNPGLRSRIAFQVNFDDYTPEELCEITSLMAKDKQLHLGDGVDEKLYGIYKNATASSDFGNGRFVRNLLEKANMRQATRLVTSGIDDISDNELSTLTAEDFEIEMPNKETAKRIGFGM